MGLLEKPNDHYWWPVLARLGVEERTSVAGSLFLLRKTLPSPPPSLPGHRARVTAPSPLLDRNYFAHVIKTTRDIFRPGWDRGYSQRVRTFIPPLSSSLESRRSKGGSRACWRGRRRQFVKDTTDVEPDWEVPKVFPVDYMSVELDGKCRGVTVASASQHRLGPLHRTIYDRLSKENWLLRGEATPGKFRDFVRVDEEVFVSGDYESATDNLSLEVAEWCLRVMRDTSRCIPDKIWNYALSSLRARINYSDMLDDVEQTRGQLMGNLLSFPLLCLQNYIAFRFFVPDTNVPVKINGDDIVFRSTREVADRWMDGVVRTGLVLSRGKTLVRGNMFSLNSMFFRARSSLPKRIPVLRTACLAREKACNAFSSQVRTFCHGFAGRALELAQAWFLRLWRPIIEASGRSVSRGLGARVLPAALKMSGLFKREAWILALPSEPRLPLIKQGIKVPKEWERVCTGGMTRSALRSARKKEEEFFEWLMEEAWYGDPVPPKALNGQINEEVFGVGRSIQNCWINWRKAQKGLGRDRGKLLKLFRSVAKLYHLNHSTVYEWCHREGRAARKVWMRRSTGHQVCFVYGGINN